jgi:hypothetical protein
MSTFEALKIAYCKSFGLEEPQTVAVLCFGALSGSIGATSVYRESSTVGILLYTPLIHCAGVAIAINLLRTRLQASGSPGHPQVYTGFKDVLSQTLQREGWFGLYKGLIPTLAKVVPAVSISYVVSLSGVELMTRERRLSAYFCRFTNTRNDLYISPEVKRATTIHYHQHHHHHHARTTLFSHEVSTNIFTRFICEEHHCIELNRL